ncbi:MAG: urease accessory protein UreF [Actinomycetes bacterium]
MSASYLNLLLADGRLPTGAHTQSAGVEPALRHGLQLEAVPDYLAVRLRTVTAVEAGAAVVARHCWGTATDRVAAVADVDAAWRSRTLSDALRDASDLLGRSYLRLTASVWPEMAPLGTAGRPWCRAVVVGAAAAEAGLDPAATARLVAYEDVQTVIAAALKLQPFDPTTGVGWAVAAHGEVEALVAGLEGLQAPAEIPAWAAPQIEEWGQRHRDTERRLFRA